jgi:hypothetical protein
MHEAAVLATKQHGESSAAIRLALKIFKIEDNGVTFLTHHLLRGFEGNCVLASACVTGCRLVEAESSSRAETNMGKECCSQKTPLPLFKAAKIHYAFGLVFSQYRPTLYSFLHTQANRLQICRFRIQSCLAFAKVKD